MFAAARRGARPLAQGGRALAPPMPLCVPKASGGAPSPEIFRSERSDRSTRPTIPASISRARLADDSRAGSAPSVQSPT